MKAAAAQSRLSNRKIGLMSGVAGLAALALPASALAQSQIEAGQPVQTPVSPQTSPTGPSPEDNSGEIIVTAQKRAQSINDVGLTIAAVSGESLRQRQVASLDDVAKLVPGLSYSNTQNGTPVFTLRGVGFYDTSLGSYPTVSVYLDEVPLSFPVLTRHSVFDLERIEVLKGPQGTLFGQNATGGAINYIAAKPTKDFQAGLEVGYGRFNRFTGEGYVSGPLSETVGIRVSGRVEHGGGWQYSVSRPGDHNANLRNYMGRLLLSYDDDDGVRFLLNVNGWKDKSSTQSPQFLALFPSYPVTPADGGAFNFPFTPFNPRAADWTPGIPYADNRMGQASLRGEVDITDAITLTSLTAYTDYKQRQGTEGDGLPIRTLELTADRGRIKSFSQELRLSNGGNQAFRWTVGANYEHSTVDQNVDNRYDESFANIYLGKTLGYPIFNSFYTNNQTMENYAVFGNGEVDVGQFVLKAGARYTEAKRKAYMCNQDPSGAPNGTGGFFFDVLLGGAYGAYSPDRCFSFNQFPDGSPVVDYLPAGAPGAYNARINEDNLSWRLGIDWKPQRGTLVYANVSKGYKAGSFPTTSASTFAQYLPVVQESVLAYELGVKLRPFDRLLQLNAAAYYYKYTDKQLRSKLRDPVFALLDVVQNIPKSDVKGAEVEAILTPGENFTLSTGFTYTRAKIKEFTGINASGVEADFAGSEVPFTPKYQLAADAEYRVPLGDSLKLFVGAAANYRSSTVAVVGGRTNPVGAIPARDGLFVIKGYTLVDARAGIASADDRWRAQLWGKNIFNKYYWNNVVSLADVIGRYTGMGATYGVTFAYKFGG
ncbi:TonB-dependent receptor [Sphingomonas sp. ID0503]|uniref:TonB-dependent receptor n=1 Tax=Sphingomonas sp. ID0503 TaxID=3399691 RepID=UPI003AFAC114